MIAGLRGVLAGKSADSVLIDVSGVIYRAGASANTIAELGEIGEDAQLVTLLVVREDSLTLYGFADAHELAMFEALNSVSGIGPRLALAILSHFKLDDLLRAIEDGDADLLATVSGVGKKTAGRLIVDLKGKLPSSVGDEPVSREDQSVLDALRSLGYSAAEAKNAIARTTFTGGMTSEDRVLAVLRELGS
jgi:Holliday junction DNA helicase RuvA